MADVFISYAREDQQRAARMAALLEQQGLSTWWDRKIPPGKTWDQVIGLALDQASCVVVLWTRNSIDSNWVKEEAARGARREVLVPVLFDHVEAPLGFGRIEAAEFSTWSGDTDDPEVGIFLSAVQSLAASGGLDPRPAPEPTSGAGPKPPGAVPPLPHRKIFLTGLSALLMLGATAGIWWLAQEPTHLLDVQIWDVEGERKTSLVATHSFSGSGDLPSPSLVGTIADWVVENAAPEATDGRRPIAVSLSIPANPGTTGIAIHPESDLPVETHLYIIRDTGKVRVRSDLNREALALLERDFVIEIGALGYSSVPVKVAWGKAMEKHVTLKPVTVKLAVEAFSGPENQIGNALTQALAPNPGLSMFGPDALAQLRLEIDNSRANVGVDRVAQMAIRDSLGVDFIISGSFRLR